MENKLDATRPNRPVGRKATELAKKDPQGDTATKLLLDQQAEVLKLEAEKIKTVNMNNWNSMLQFDESKSNPIIAEYFRKEKLKIVAMLQKMQQEEEELTQEEQPLEE